MTSVDSKLASSVPPHLTVLSISYEARGAPIKGMAPVFGMGDAVQGAKLQAQSVGYMITAGARDDLPKRMAELGVTLSADAPNKLVLYPERFTSNCSVTYVGRCNVTAFIKGTLTDPTGRVLWTYTTIFGNSSVCHEPSDDWPEFSSHLIAAMKKDGVI